MSRTLPSLGLTADELRRYVSNAVTSRVVTDSELVDTFSPAEVAARRIAWEAAAALVAANNRRLALQLQQLGLLDQAAPLLADRLPADTTASPPAPLSD